MRPSPQPINTDALRGGPQNLGLKQPILAQTEAPSENETEGIVFSEGNPPAQFESADIPAPSTPSQQSFPEKIMRRSGCCVLWLGAVLMSRRRKSEKNK